METVRLSLKLNSRTFQNEKSQKYFDNINALPCIFLVALVTLMFCGSCNSPKKLNDDSFFKSVAVETNLREEQNVAYRESAIKNSLASTGISISAPKVIVGKKTFRAEIADSREKRERGLSKRNSLEQSSGMLFVYPDNVAGGFWMLDMLFPLDFIWIGEDCRVVDLTENVVVDTNQAELHVYYSTSPAAFNFEVNAGEIELSNIQIGDIVQFKNIDVEGISCGQQ